MKKFLAFLLTAALSLSVISCTRKVETVTYKLGVVDGAPSLAVANVLSDGFAYTDKGVKYKVEVELVNGANLIRAGLISGEYDMAIAPLNLAASIYNVKPELGVKLASVNIFGCLYMIGDDTLSGLSELKGKTVISVGAGGTPDVVLRNLLGKNEIGINGEDENDEEKVTLTYAEDAAGIIKAFNKGEADYALLGEPAVTTVAGKVGKVVALDLQSEWKKFYGEVNFVQAGLFTTGEASENTAFVNAFLNKLQANAEFLTENLDKLNGIFETAESTLKATQFSEELIARCNVGCRRASDVKDDVVRFLTAVYEYNKTQVGGKLPADDFYM